MRDRAKVQRYKPMRIDDITSKERAVLSCGCCVWVGLTGAREAATRAQACSVEHLPITERASQLLIESTARPAKQLLVDTCARILTQAAREA